MNDTQITKGSTITAWNPGCPPVTGEIVEIGTWFLRVAWSRNGKNYVGQFTNWGRA